MFRISTDRTNSSRGYAQFGRPFANLLPGYSSMAPAGANVAATLFLQAALDNAFALPVSEKLTNIRNVLDSGVTLLNAVLVYRASAAARVAARLPVDSDSARCARYAS